MRYFNTAGSCSRAKHYMIEPSTRLKGVEQLIDTEQYFVIHAARQSGKTTCLHDLTSRLNAGGRYYAVCCTLENMQNIVDLREGVPEIVKTIKNTLKKQNVPIDKLSDDYLYVCDLGLIRDENAIVTPSNPIYMERQTVHKAGTGRWSNRLHRGTVIRN